MPCWDKDPAARPSFVALAQKLEQLTEQLATGITDAPLQPSTRKNSGFENEQYSTRTRPKNNARDTFGFDNALYNGGPNPGGDGYIHVGAGGAGDGAIEAYGVRVSVEEAKKRSGFHRQDSAKNAKQLFGVEKHKPDVITEYVHARAARAPQSLMWLSRGRPCLTTRHSSGSA